MSLKFSQDRSHPGSPTNSSNACGASTANIDGLTTAASRSAMIPGILSVGTYY